jgi:hypothetical protein
LSLGTYALLRSIISFCQRDNKCSICRHHDEYDSSCVIMFVNIKIFPDIPIHLQLAAGLPKLGLSPNSAMTHSCFLLTPFVFSRITRGWHLHTRKAPSVLRNTI